MNDETETNSSMNRKNDFSAWWISLFFAILCTSLLILGKFYRAGFDSLMWEDAAGEWATFWAFAIAGIIGLVALFRAIWCQSDEALKENQFWFRIIMGGLSAFCLAAAGEEISWGQRVLGFMPPDMFQEMNFQQEFNLHNILAYFVSPRFIIAIICFGYGVLLPYVAFYYRSERKSTSLHLTEVVAPRSFLVPWFLLAGVAYWTGWPLPIVSYAEAVEMLLGLLLLADVLEKTKLLGVVSPGGSNGLSGLKPVCILTFAVVLGATANPLLERFWFGSDPDKVEQARQELIAIGRDLEDKERFNVDVVRSNEVVGSRILNALRSGWLYFEDQGHFRTETGAEKNTDLGRRQTYFLDPWNNVYWIRMRGLEPIFLYSFGPNRRLDTVMDHIEGVPTEAQLKGDDVGIWIDPFRKFREVQEANGK